MRKSPFIIAYSTLLSIFAAGQVSYAGDHLSAAPLIPHGEKDRTAGGRAPKLIPVTAEQVHAEVKQLQTELLLKPHDAQLHFKLGEAFRKQDRTHLAVVEYVKAINYDPTLWVAYHQLTANTNDSAILDEEIAKLTKLETEKPRELLLRVALSELFEKRGNYYQAARTLIDLSYANAVPEKFRAKVSARIHNMLVLSKSQPNAQNETAAAGTHPAGAHTAAATHPNTDASSSELAPSTAANIEEDMDLMPAPIPVPGTKRSIAQAKLKDAKEVRGMGHTPLLP